jgi:aspartyl-tRNA synthetase
MKKPRRIRIHTQEVQSKMFSLMGIKPEISKVGFSVHLNTSAASQFAFGFDRIIMLMMAVTIQNDSFKTGISLMDDAPDG